ncbi:MAG: aldehyde ferredoxin oxidoreductase family protein [Thermanaeromonas sp.]|uniref:aldehyde ferredoxin oxidoreductase family protein n=1 Tax=Thermanaeromonas sp. TaxID=2003697 RepID=UPI002438282D|nr:aldehyde ferredoxin oxidoreductase family protein [Thermanaeromonas sp.]MCG0278507.1 aldehyde ferredoxin oxidoreductase family protein [Thermanaeromonas sp.]
MRYGYVGKVLWVDLTQRKWWVEEVDEALASKWLGGSGFGAITLAKTTGPQTDPLGEENVLGFFTGPLTGTVVPCSGRHSVVGKSPLTGIWGEASVGGNWGKELKRAGYDGVVVLGKADTPVYLWINEGEVEIRDAAKLWGLDTYQTAEALQEYHPGAEVCTIGPAGERLVRIAGLFTDGKEGRAAARCGLGAVAGSKKLKALVVQGTRRPNLAFEEELKTKAKEAIKLIKEKTKGLSEFGTAGLVIPCEQIGDFPIRNWRDGKWEEGAQKISGPRMVQTVLSGRFHCAGCPIGCGRRVSITDGPYAGVNGGGPEYETLGLMGGSCLIDNLEAICYANELCNRYGIDTIEAANLIAFSIEAFERGIVKEKDTGGLILRWGDPQVLIELIHQMGQNRGFGAFLARGFRSLLAEFGQEAEEFAIQVKGLGFPAHDPRAYNSIAVGYATANRGACHLEGFSHIFERNVALPEFGFTEPQDRFSVEGKGRLVAQAQNLMSVFDSLALCKFILFGGIKIKDLVEWLNLATGLDFTSERLLECGERIFNLKRLYNVKCGISRKDDVLPPRILTQKRGSGGAAENLPPLDQMLNEYYAVRGWNENGIPTQETLDRLGLEEFIS